MDETILVNYLQGECNDEEAARVEAWCEEGPENRKGVLLFRHPFRSYRQAGPRRIGPDDGRPDEADRR